MLNKIASVVLVLLSVLLLIIGNVKNTVATRGLYNKKLLYLTFVSLLYMIVVVCNKSLTSVGGVPTALLFGLSFLACGVRLLTKDEDSDVTSIVNKDEKTGVKTLGGIASVVSLLLGLVLTLSVCKK